VNRSSLRGRRLAGVVATSVVVLALPAAALATPEEPAPEVEPVAAPSPAEVSGTADEPVFAACPSVTTLSPGTGNAAGDRVTVTAQALDQGVAGWSLVAWQAAAGHRITAVAITRDGSTTVLDDPPTTHAEDVDVLTVCTEPDPDHTTDGGDGGGATGPEERAGAGEVGPTRTLDAPAPDDPVTVADTRRSSADPAGPAEAGSVPTGDEPRPLAADTVAPEASTPIDEATDDRGDDADVTEVLGVTRARTAAQVSAAPTADAATTQGSVPVVPGLLAGSLLLGGLLFATSRLRHRDRKRVARETTA
jgi:hypothetical protein